MSSLYNLAKDLIYKEAYFEVGSILEDLFKIKCNYDLVDYSVVEGYTTLTFNHRFYHDYMTEENNEMISHKYMLRIHNINNPASYKRTADGFELTWYSHDMRHREGGPAVIRYYDDENTVIESWYMYGRPYNPNGCCEKHIKDGIVIFKLYTDENGLFHRDEYPAYKSYYDNGIPRIEIYYHHGKMHREGRKPGLIEYDHNGNIIREEYYLNNLQQYE